MANAIPPESDKRRFEIRDASAKRIAILTVGLALALVVILVAIWYAYRFYTGISPASADSEHSAWSHAEKSLQSIADDRRELEAQESSRLETYQWIDRERGLARIPIERAMSLVVEQGLPQWGNPNEPKTLLDMTQEKAAAANQDE